MKVAAGVSLMVLFSLIALCGAIAWDTHRIYTALELPRSMVTYEL